MTMKRVMLAVLAATTLGTLCAVPAAAQYGGRYYDDYDDRPRFRRYGRRGGSICVTARGNCPYPPQPFNTPCACDIPGFGTKRGAIGG